MSPSDLGYDLSALIVLKRSSLGNSADAKKILSRIRGRESKALAAEILQLKGMAAKKTARSTTKAKAAKPASKAKKVMVIGRLAGTVKAVVAKKK